MRSFRLIIAILLALVFSPASNCCLLAGLMPAAKEACCSSEGNIPADDSCSQCVTLESGVNLAALAQVAAPMPVLWEDMLMVGLIQRLIDAALEERAAAPLPEESLSPPPLLAVTLSKALPVRGPSLAA